MNKIIISADSTCDISPALKEQYGFHIVPLYVNLGDDSFQDGVTITPEDIYAFVAANKQLPKTAAATIPDYVEAFSQFTKEGYDVIHFNISASMSVTHHNATLAAEEVEGEGKVYVVDSANLSTGTALLMLDAYDMKEAGKSAEEIVAEIEKRVPLVRASFVVDTLDYLKMGGRCSAVAALGANLLKLHPRIYVSGGKMGAAEKYRGSIDSVIVKYANQMLQENAGKVVGNRCFVTHTKCRPETVQIVIDTVKAAGIFDEIIETEAGSVVNSHCGPGTLGVLFEVTE
ncbi:MAG: DegV family protein [Clostridia bacterium]|nr:DegV family protein [Clostridia bacterium]